MNTASFRYDINSIAEDMEVDLKSISALYSEYFLEMKDNLNKSKNLCKSGEYKRLERVIHNIKGISHSLNIIDIYNVANKLDIELLNNNTNNTLMFLNIISDLFNTCETDIKQFFTQNSITI